MMLNRWRQRCLSDGALRMAIDGDVAVHVLAHIDSCPRCGERLAELASNVDRARPLMTALDPAGGDVDTRAAFTRFKTNHLRDEDRIPVSGGGRMREFAGRRAVQAATVFVALFAIVAAMSFTPVGALADNWLRELRVQKFAAVTIPMDLIEPMQSSVIQNLSDEDKEALKQRFDALGTFETTFDFDMENALANLPESMTVDEAATAYGSEFDVPDDMPDGFTGDPNAFVTQDGSVTYTLNVQEAQDLIRQLGLPIYSLPDPDEYPTLEFSANIPAAVVLHYTSDDARHVVVGQMMSPRLSIPEGLDMDMLREDLLQLPLPTDLKSELQAIDDWEETLIVPVPESASTDDITVNGESGLLITDSLGSAVLWEKDGILYAVAGQVSADEVREIADSMQ